MTKMYTLAQGARARQFAYEEDDSYVIFYTGKDFQTRFAVSKKEIEKMLQYFSMRDWFILGNQVDNIKPYGMGEYFKVSGCAMPKNASHVAAYLVKYGKLEYRDYNGYLEFKVKNV